MRIKQEKTVNTVLLMIIVLFIFFTGLSWAGENKVNPCLVNFFIKPYIENRWKRERVYAVIEVITDANIDSLKNRRWNLFYADKKGQKIISDVLKVKGWQEISPFSLKKTLSVIYITFEPRIRGIVTKTYVYVGDNDYMYKRRREISEKYFFQIVRKMEENIKYKYHLINKNS